MEETDVKRLGYILAVQAEIEGMKVDNEVRESRGEAHSYFQDDFDRQAGRLRDIASASDGLIETKGEQL